MSDMRNLPMDAIAACDAAVERLRAEVTEVRRQRDIFKEDFTCTQKRLNDALDQLRCPDCKCADQIDAESSECGCDSPICARNDGKTLAESWISLRARVAELEAECDRLQSLANVYRTEVMASRNERAAFFSKTMNYEEWQAASRQVEIARADTDAARAANGGAA